MKNTLTIETIHPNSFSCQPHHNPIPFIDLDAEFAARYARRGDLGLARVVYSDGSDGKCRPIVILAKRFRNFVIAPMTTHHPRDEFDIELPPAHWGLKRAGVIRCSQICLVSDTSIERIVGHLPLRVFEHVIKTTERWFHQTIVAPQTIPSA